MKTKQHPLWFRALAAFMAALVVAVSTPTVYAVDVQTLPENTQAATGFTHQAKITWDDLNATDNSATVLQLFAIPTNCYIDRVGYYMDENFTNATYVATGGSTNLVLTVGVGGATNAFFGSNTLIYARSCALTNLLVPYRATTSTNYLIATFSDGLQASEVDGYLVGKIRVFWRLVQPTKIRQ